MTHIEPSRPAEPRGNAPKPPAGKPAPLRPGVPFLSDRLSLGTSLSGAALARVAFGPDAAPPALESYPAFQALPPAAQAQWCSLAPTLPPALVRECLELFPPAALEQLARGGGSGFGQRLACEFSEQWLAQEVSRRHAAPILAYLKQDGQADSLADTVRELLRSDAATWERGQLLLQILAAEGLVAGPELELLRLEVSFRYSDRRLQEELRQPQPDKYTLVLLQDQFNDLGSRLASLNGASPRRQLELDVQTASLQNRWHLSNWLADDQARQAERAQLKESYRQSLQESIRSADARIGQLEAKQATLGRQLQGHPQLARAVTDFHQHEEQAAVLQHQLDDKLRQYRQTPSFFARSALNQEIGGLQQQLAEAAGRRQELSRQLADRLAAHPEVRAGYQALHGVRRELFQARLQREELRALQAETEAIGDTALVLKALAERRGDGLKLSLRDGLSYQSVRTALHTLLHRKGDRSAMQAEIRMGATLFSVGDAYFMGGFKLEAESDAEGRVVLSFAGFGGGAGRMNNTVVTGRLPGAVALKQEYVFANLDDATRFILAAMNAYDPAFLDAVPDVRPPVRGALPGPGVYTCEPYKVIPVTLEVAGKLNTRDVRVTVNYENLAYQATGKYYESKVDVLAEGAGLAAALTLEWEVHGDRQELKDTPYYGSAVEFKVDLANFNGKAVSTRSLADAMTQALAAARHKFHLTPEAWRNLQALVQQAADRAVAEASRHQQALAAQPEMKARLGESDSATVEGEISSKLLIRFPFGRDQQGGLYLHTPQLGLDNRFILSADGRLPWEEGVALMVGAEVRAEMRKMLTTERLEP